MVPQYRQTCASCPGPNGRGDGQAGKDLSPPPGDLAWLARMPMGQWDAYLYWAIAEGGEAFGTGMPAHKDALSADDIWTVVTYIEAGLPAGSSGPTGNPFVRTAGCRPGVSIRPGTARLRLR